MVYSIKDRVSFFSQVTKGGFSTDILKGFDGPNDHNESEYKQYLTDGLPHEISQINQVDKEPLKLNPALHMEFVELVHIPESIIDFANKYGRLGGEVEEQVLLHAAKGMSSGDVGEGEPVERWYEEIDNMKSAVDAWMRLQSFIGAQINSIGEDTLPKAQAETGSKSQDTDSSSEVSIESQVADLRNTVKERLAGNVFVEPLSSQSKGKGLIALCLRPSSLLTAMWLQLSMDVEEGREYRRCSVCNRWMEVTPITRRQNAKYCSGACRAKAYRGRKMD